MPVVPINYLALLACAVASMVLGSLWYGPLFGKPWMKEMGISKPDTMDAKMKKEMNKSYSLMFVGSLVMAYVLAHSLVFASTYLKVEGVSAGVMAGFWSWLGFIAPVTLGSVLWERKSWKLWMLNNGYQLVNICVAGVILAMWK